MSAFALALWTLDRFAIDDTAIGDLIEQVHTGRSAVWMWRQTLGLIARAVARVIRMNPVQGIAIASLSTATLCLWFVLTLGLYRWEIRSSVIQPWLAGSRLLFFAWHVYCVPLHLAWLTGCVTIGRIVARRSLDGAPLVVVCALVQLPLDVWFGWPYVHAIIQPQMPLLLRYYIGHVTDAVIALAGLPVGMIAAGVFAASTHR
jgi:hypothetical protein